MGRPALPPERWRCIDALARFEIRLMNADRCPRTGDSTWRFLMATYPDTETRVAWRRPPAALVPGTSPHRGEGRPPSRRALVSAMRTDRRASGVAAPRQGRFHSQTPRLRTPRFHPTSGGRARHSRDLHAAPTEEASRAARRCAARSASSSSTPSSAPLVDRPSRGVWRRLPPGPSASWPRRELHVEGHEAYAGRGIRRALAAEPEGGEVRHAVGVQSDDLAVQKHRRG